MNKDLKDHPVHVMHKCNPNNSLAEGKVFRFPRTGSAYQVQADGSVRAEFKRIPKAARKQLKRARRWNRLREMGQGLVALGNSTEHDLADFVALENELALDNDGWALLAPFGEHRKERLATVNGQIVTERYLQLLDEPAVDAVIANEKGTNLLQRIKRALVKRPIYRDHPDLKLYSPASVAVGNQELTPLGLNGGCRKTARGLEFQPNLTPAGAIAIENDGCKFPSALFLLKKTGVVRDGGWIEVRPFALASIGLTPTPNISGVDSLANARANQPAASAATKTNEDTIMKQLLIGWLAAQGITLANDSTDQIVFDAVNKAWTDRTVSATALGNEKTTLTSTVTSLTATAAAEKQRADAATTALANATTEVTAFRKSAIEARVDLAITQGKVALAERTTEITALENSKDLTKDLATLDQRAVKHNVTPAIDASRKVDANSSSASLALGNAMEVHTKAGKTKSQALDLVMKESPALYEAYRKEGGAL